ncbi:hypothetical protein HHI36_017453 [Cryptolaemus montrouzieri]|uniref:Mitogen-activated protein kinase kinase kinase N-terminal domain-containing protein n=1 Tax=Cryptolaemus montrouzieri TaxID=559131 RepID=A0ABD2NNC8_9CUCU
MADELSPDHDEYDIYGKTPPRTKILRKHRERRQRDKAGSMSTKSIKIKTPIGRRNTISHFYDDMIAKAENTDSDHGSGGVTPKRMNKRQIKLLRGSERDLKLDIASAQAVRNTNGTNGFDGILSPQPSYQIGCNKKFMCLSGRTVCCPKSNRHSYDSKLAENKHREKEYRDEEEDEGDEGLANRIEFHQTLCLLVRMGCADKQHPDRTTRRISSFQLSREEYLWHECKDVIWLELRAFHANRTAVEEDEYLCKARQEVETLLNDIMSYRFKYQRKLKPQNGGSVQNNSVECSGCISIHCTPCLEAQTEALEEIEEISKRLEKAEALFPSGKAFAELFPLYRSSEFEARVKTISLWVNMVRLHRIKLMLLGRFLFFLDTKNCTWNVPTDKPKVEVNSSPSDSNNSSSSNEYCNEVKGGLDYYNNNFLFHLMNLTENGGLSPYRRYIENVLKTKAVKKSLNFLETLHVHVLNKAQLTLEKPEDLEIFKLNSTSTEEQELQRYGAWSPEAEAINLPSYRAAFLFLAAVPLEVIHQFMLLRLEQRPPNPSPLSIRQLMRELKEGLSLAITQRIRTNKYIKGAIKSTDLSIDEYNAKLRTFDECVEKVFVDYLDYLEKWALFEHETFQKSLLEEEWLYCCEIIQYIPNGQEKLEIKFCKILSSILKTIGERLMKNTEHLVGSILHEEDVKYSIFGVCRELQTLLNEEREMSIKALSFCKTIFKHDVSHEATWTLKLAILAFKCIIPEAIEKYSLFSPKSMEL